MLDSDTRLVLLPFLGGRTSLLSFSLFLSSKSVRIKIWTGHLVARNLGEQGLGLRLAALKLDGLIIQSPWFGLWRKRDVGLRGARVVILTKPP